MLRLSLSRLSGMLLASLCCNQKGFWMLWKSGKTMVNYGFFNGILSIRLITSNGELEHSDIDLFFEYICEIGSKLCQKKIKKLQNEVNKLFTQEESSLEQESTRYKEDIKKNVEALQGIHKKSIKALPDKSSENKDKSDDIDPEGWDIDYDE